MKKIIVIFSLFIVMILAGCNSIRYKIVEGTGEIKEREYALEDSQKLEIKNITIKNDNSMTGATVEIINSTERKVVVETRESLLSKIKCKISFNTLKVYGVKNEAYVCEGIEIKIYGYTFKEIALASATQAIVDEECVGSEKVELDLSGASSLSVPNLQSQSLNLDLSGASTLEIGNCSVSGKMNVDLSGASKIVLAETSASKVVMDLSGASTLIIEKLTADLADIELSGASRLSIINGGLVKDSELQCSGASMAMLHPMNCERVELSLSGASNATLTFSDSLEGSISGGSSLTYHGDANRVDISQSGGAMLFGTNQE